MALDLRISIHKLDVLTRVVALGGVSRAAEDLFVAQPVVTSHIRSLERRLGTVLFYREGRQYHLTDAGQLVHSWAQDVLTRTRELERDLDALSEGSTGNVVLGSSMTVGSYFLPQLLASFHAKHPGAKLRLDISSTEHAIEDARTGALDFAVVAVMEPDMELPGMHAERIGSDRIVLAASPGLVPRGGTITIDELSRLPFIDAPEGSAYARFVDRCLREAGLAERDISLQFGHPEAIKQAAQQGQGVTTLIRASMREELEAGVLRELHVDGINMSIPISLIYRKGKIFSKLHEELIGEIRAIISDQTEDDQRV